MRTLYNSLIHPYLSCYVMLLGGASAIALDKLEKLQKSALRLISGARYRDHAGPLFKQAGLLKICDLYLKDVILFMFKLEHNLLPACCLTYIIRIPSRHYSLRTTDCFAPIFAKSRVRLKALTCIGSKTCNSCTDHIRSSESLSILKKRLLEFFLSNYM